LLRSKPHTIFDILYYRKLKKLVRGKANFAVSSAHLTHIMTSWEQLLDVIYFILCMYVMPLTYAHLYMHLYKNQVTLLGREKLWYLM